MTAPIPKMVADEVQAEMAALIVTIPRYLDADDPRILDWMSRLEAAIPAGRAKAFLAMAQAQSFSGDIDACERYLERAFTAGASEANTEWSRLAIYENLGRPARALEAAIRTVDIRHATLTIGIPRLIACGGFSHAYGLLDQAEKANVDLSALEQIDDIRRIAGFAASSGIPDERFAAVLEVAGELMREQRLLWLDMEPRFLFDDEMECAGIRYRICMSPEFAADLNWTLAERLIERDLDQVPLTAGFVGVDDQVATAHAD